MARNPSNIALVGFMGTGKSSTGNLLADMAGFEFVDTDALIERQTGKSIPDIFADQGEAMFRDLETQVGESLATRRGLVIATGGGFVLRTQNLEKLKTHSLVVCLWASPEAIFERVRFQDHRPLLKGPNPLGTIRAMLAEREPVYRQADVLVNTEQRSCREVAVQVLNHFHSARR